MLNPFHCFLHGSNTQWVKLKSIFRNRTWSITSSLSIKLKITKLKPPNKRNGRSQKMRDDEIKITYMKTIVTKPENPFLSWMLWAATHCFVSGKYSAQNLSQRDSSSNLVFLWFFLLLSFPFTGRLHSRVPSPSISSVFPSFFFNTLTEALLSSLLPFLSAPQKLPITPQKNLSQSSMEASSLLCFSHLPPPKYLSLFFLSQLPAWKLTAKPSPQILPSLSCQNPLQPVSLVLLWFLCFSSPVPS